MALQLQGTPGKAGQSPPRSPPLSPACPLAPLAQGLALALLPACCLEAIQDSCLVSMATPVEITLKRNETSGFSGWQAGGGELRWERPGGGGSLVGGGCGADEVPHGVPVLG